METTTRVLYVTINMERGGTEGQLMSLALGLAARGFSPRVCCIRGGGPLAETLARRGVPVTVCALPPLRYRRTPRALGSFLVQVRCISRIIRLENPEIVHAMLPLACVAAGLAARLAGVPALVTSRRGLGYYKEGRLLLRAMERLVNRWADAIIANSEAVRSDTLRRERLDPRKAHVIYNGVALPPPRPPRTWRELAGRDVAGPSVLLPANFHPYKGHADFIAAAARVLEKMPDAAFVFAGDGALRGEIEKGVRATGRERNFILLGSRPDVRELMAASDVVALSSHEEGFPNVLLEAMAEGKPVAATRVGGVPEAVEQGTTGLLVPPRDPAAMAAALLRLLGDRGESEAMGRRGRERVERHFTIARMVRSYEELYRGLLRGKRSASREEADVRHLRLGQRGPA